MRGSQFQQIPITEAVVQQKIFDNHKKQLQTIQPSIDQHKVIRMSSQLLNDFQDKFIRSKLFKNIQKWHDQDKEHKRIISTLKSIQEGKFLSVGQADLRQKSITTARASISPIQRNSIKSGSLKISHYYQRRKHELKKIDDDNMKILSRIANPIRSPSINIDEFYKFSSQHTQFKNRLSRANRDSLMQILDSRESYLLKNLKKDSKRSSIMMSYQKQKFTKIDLNKNSAVEFHDLNQSSQVLFQNTSNTEIQGSQQALKSNIENLSNRKIHQELQMLNQQNQPLQNLSFNDQKSPVSLGNVLDNLNEEKNDDKNIASQNYLDLIQNMPIQKEQISKNTNRSITQIQKSDDKYQFSKKILSAIALNKKNNQKQQKIFIKKNLLNNISSKNTIIQINRESSLQSYEKNINIEKEKFYDLKNQSMIIKESDILCTPQNVISSPSDKGKFNQSIQKAQEHYLLQNNINLQSIFMKKDCSINSQNSDKNKKKINLKIETSSRDKKYKEFLVQQQQRIKALTTKNNPSSIEQHQQKSYLMSIDVQKNGAFAFPPISKASPKESLNKLIQIQRENHNVPIQILSIASQNYKDQLIKQSIQRKSNQQQYQTWRTHIQNVKRYKQIPVYSNSPKVKFQQDQLINQASNSFIQTDHNHNISNINSLEQKQGSFDTKDNVSQIKIQQNINEHENQISEKQSKDILKQDLDFEPEPADIEKIFKKKAEKSFEEKKIVQVDSQVLLQFNVNKNNSKTQQRNQFFIHKNLSKSVIKDVQDEVNENQKRVSFKEICDVPVIDSSFQISPKQNMRYNQSDQLKQLINQDLSTAIQQQDDSQNQQIEKQSQDNYDLQLNLKTDAFEVNATINIGDKNKIPSLKSVSLS